MRRRRIIFAIASFALTLRIVALSVIAVEPAAAATVAPAVALPAANRMPGDVPSRRTPGVLNGEVTKIVQIGNVMVAGGLFTPVPDPMNGTPATRQNLFAFDATPDAVDVADASAA